MAVIKVQKIPKKTLSAEEKLMRFCFLYQQYTYDEAKKLPARRIHRMITVARQEQARTMYNIVRAIAAPHTKRGQEVKKILEELKDIIDS